VGVSVALWIVDASYDSAGYKGQRPRVSGREGSNNNTGYAADCNRCEVEVFGSRVPPDARGARGRCPNLLKGDFV
jgi:hypothetical protein